MKLKILFLMLILSFNCFGSQLGPEQAYSEFDFLERAAFTKTKKEKKKQLKFKQKVSQDKTLPDRGDVQDIESLYFDKINSINAAPAR